MTMAEMLRIGSYLGMFTVMLGFERWAPFVAYSQVKTSRVIFHLAISMANSIVLYFTTAWVMQTTFSLVETRHYGLSHLLGLDGALELITSVLILDAWTYGLHWAYHRNRFLWRFHRAHHTDTELDVTTASRFHIGELVISGMARCLLMLVWGPSLGSLVLFDVLLNLASQFHHSNVAIPISIQDRLEQVVVTPRMHRCHHAFHHHCLDTNFAGILSLWDRLGRTYHHSRHPEELEIIGLAQPRGPETMKLKAFLMTPLDS